MKFFKYFSAVCSFDSTILGSTAAESNIKECAAPLVEDLIDIQHITNQNNPPLCTDLPYENISGHSAQISTQDTCEATSLGNIKNLITAETLKKTQDLDFIIIYTNYCKKNL